MTLDLSFNLTPIFPQLQLKDLQVFTIIRVIFQLSEEIPCISAVVVALLSEVLFGLYCYNNADV